ncbi:Crp/Fnr family transcriptional regulator [Bradyrhizobium sp. A11]|jgi:CRP/FNR family cyclic AMP-dependent transcriptional regulator|uniref:Crp/Fnr family transcriptional regulator n=1 Tax=Bradyrhizobium sp. A11 TaxID=3133974 RepID=UPI003255AB24
MLSKETSSEIVSRKGWLRNTPPSFRSAVLKRCLVKHFGAGAPIYAIGDEPGGLYGLVEGGLGVSIAPGEVGPYTAHFAMPGAWFGEGSVFTRQPRKVGLTATRPTTLLHLPVHGVDEIVCDDPDAWRLFGLLALDHLDLAMGGSDDLMIRNHVKRFVAVLLRLGDCRVATPANDQPIEVDLNHEDIAYMANVARTTAGAILRRLEADGHVTLSYRCVGILAPDTLRKMLRD